MKKSETQLSATERLKDFDPSKFKAGNSVLYRAGGRWQFGVLASEPTVAGKKIELSLNGSPAPVEINLPPKKVDFNVGDVKRVDGKDFRVSQVVPGPDGEIWYELTENAPAAGVAAEVRSNVEQDTIKKAGEIAKAETVVNDASSKVSIETARLLIEVRNIQGEERQKLIGRLADLDKKIKEMQTHLGTIAPETEATALAAVTQKVKELKQAVDVEMRQLDDDIQSAADAEKGAGEGKLRHDLGETLSNRAAREAQALDLAEETAWQLVHDAWITQKKEFDIWKAEVDELTKRTSGGGGGGKGKGGGPPPAPPDPADVARLAFLNLPANRKIAPVGAEPKLEKPSERKDSKIAIWMKLYKELWKAISAGTATKEMEDLMNEVIKLRTKEAAPNGDYDPVTDKNQFEASTAEHLSKLVENWKALTAGPELFKFDTEVAALKQKAKDLHTKIYQLGNAAFQTELDEIIDGTPGTPGSGIKLLDKKNANVRDQVVDLMKRMGDLDVKVYEAEIKKGAKPAAKEAQEQETGQIDLPKNVVKEMLNANTAGAMDMMNAAYLAVIEEGSSRANLESSLAKFVDNLTPSAGLRDSLARAGVRDWDAFKRRFKAEVVTGLAAVLMEKADSELRSWLSQTLSEIKGDPAKWYQFTKKLGDAWDESAIKKMKGGAAIRMLVSVGVIGGVGFGTNFLLKLIPTPGVAKAKGAIVGGVVGLAKSAVNWVFGRKAVGFQEKAEKARAEAEKDKKELIGSELMRKMFEAKYDPTTGGRIGFMGDDELARVFSTALREVTREKETAADGTVKEKTLEVKDGTNTIVLKGDAIVMYHEALKRAAEDEGVDESDKIKFEIAKALHAVHNNVKAELTETAPLSAQVLKKFTDAYAGRIKQKPGTRKAEVVQRMTPGAKVQRAGEDEEVGFMQQAFLTSAVGATVGQALMSHTMGGRMAVGGVIAGAKGLETQYQKDLAKADMGSRAELEKALAAVDILLDKGAVANDAEVKELRNYRDLFAALQSGRSTEQDLANLPDNVAKYFKAHARDVAGFLQRNAYAATQVESVQREIARSGLLERGGIKDAIRNLKLAGEKMTDEAKNSAWVGLGRKAKQYFRAGVYAGLGAGASYVAGETIEAMRRHGVFGMSDAGHPQSEQTRAGITAQGQSQIASYNHAEPQPIPVVSPEQLTLKGDPTEELLKQAAKDLHGHYDVDKQLDTVEAQRLSNVAANLEKLGTGHSIRGLELPKDANGAVIDVDKIFRIDKTGVHVLDVDNFKKLEEALMARAERTHVTSDQGAWQVGKRDWSKVLPTDVEDDVENLKGPAVIVPEAAAPVPQGDVAPPGGEQLLSEAEQLLRDKQAEVLGIENEYNAKIFAASTRINQPGLFGEKLDRAHQELNQLQKEYVTKLDKAHGELDALSKRLRESALAVEDHDEGGAIAAMDETPAGVSVGAKEAATMFNHPAAEYKTFAAWAKSGGVHGEISVIREHLNMSDADFDKFLQQWAAGRPEVNLGDLRTGKATTAFNEFKNSLATQPASAGVAHDVAPPSARRAPAEELAPTPKGVRGGRHAAAAEEREYRVPKGAKVARFAVEPIIGEAVNKDVPFAVKQLGSGKFDVAFYNANAPAGEEAMHVKLAGEYKPADLGTMLKIEIGGKSVIGSIEVQPVGAGGKNVPVFVPEGGGAGYKIVKEGLEEIEKPGPVAVAK